MTPQASELSFNIKQLVHILLSSLDGIPLHHRHSFPSLPPPSPPKKHRHSFPVSGLRAEQFSRQVDVASFPPPPPNIRLEGPLFKHPSISLQKTSCYGLPSRYKLSLTPFSMVTVWSDPPQQSVVIPIATERTCKRREKKNTLATETDNVSTKSYLVC